VVDFKIERGQQFLAVGAAISLALQNKKLLALG
jgi:hypothetical protein